VRSVSKGKGEAFTAVVEYGKCIRVLKTFKVRERRTGLRDSIEILDGKVIRAPREDVIGAQAFIRNFSRQGYSVYHVMRARTIVEKEFPPVRARR